MNKDLKLHKCLKEGLCILNKRNRVYSVYGRAKGRKTNYKLLNNDHLIISQYSVDDCILIEISDEYKCDFLFIVNRAEDICDGYFVEMKGYNIDKASCQILSTINQLQSNITGNVFARIVTTKISRPNIKQASNYRKLKKMLIDKIQHKNIFLEEIV